MEIKKNLINDIGNDYHVIVISDLASVSKPKIELLGMRKLSKTKYQTILNAMNK